MRYRTNGKLLLTGEYLVLDGAKALALPTLKGQLMDVNPGEKNQIIWEARDVRNEKWLEINISLKEEQWVIESATNQQQAEWVAKLLNYVYRHDAELFEHGLIFKTKLEFERNWGLGSSSTIIACIAQWAGMEPFTLLRAVSKGSGYDVACANSTAPIFYTLKEDGPNTEKIELKFPFEDELFFVHLGLKQNSEAALEFYNQKRSRKRKIATAASRVSEISEMLPYASTLKDFELLLDEHENILAELLDMERVQTALFENYDGVVKSLGAWGGDFVLATGAYQNKKYFEKYGLTTIIPYEEMIMNL